MCHDVLLLLLLLLLLLFGVLIWSGCVGFLLAWSVIHPLGHLRFWFPSIHPSIQSIHLAPLMGNSRVYRQWRTPLDPVWPSIPLQGDLLGTGKLKSRGEGPSRGLWGPFGRLHEAFLLLMGTQACVDCCLWCDAMRCGAVRCGAVRWCWHKDMTTGCSSLAW